MVPRRESGRAVCSNGFTSQEAAMVVCTPLFPHGRAKVMALSETAILVYLLTTAVTANDTDGNRAWEQSATQTETLSMGLVLFIVGGCQEFSSRLTEPL